MTDGFEIQITEVDFKAKPLGEQNWILFQGISGVSKCVHEIDEKGCEFARKKHKIAVLKLASAISGGITFALGMMYIVYQIIFR